jgi:site-specific DNA-methyltransferase (cytosine-N4-specific)
MFSIANTSSRDVYRDGCIRRGIKANPARIPWFIPHFFIRFLTDPGDLVVDPFAGSNITGSEAENLGRRWIAIERDTEYVRGSIFRFEKIPSLTINSKSSLPLEA